MYIHIITERQGEDNEMTKGKKRTREGQGGDKGKDRHEDKGKDKDKETEEYHRGKE